MRAQAERWVCFDVGETIFDEMGLWDRWADWLGVARGDFRHELAAIIGCGRHHREVFQHFRPGFDLAEAQAARLEAGEDPGFHTSDLFPDVKPCLRRLRAAGFRIAIAGNTTVLTEHAVTRAGLGPDLLASAARWGTSKPDPAFFRRLAEACEAPPDAITYVGDRLDNDALPAVAAGMAGVWLRRGLWAEAQRDLPEASRATAIIDTLDQLPSVLEAVHAERRRT